MAVDKTSFVFPTLLKRIGWKVVLLLLLFLPFQFNIYHRMNLPNHFLWVDEIFIVFAFTLFLFILLHQGKISKDANRIFTSLLFFSIIGIVSGLFNFNSFAITTNGIFDYIKNFLAIPVFCLFSVTEKKVSGLYKILHRLALFLCLVAILQVIAFFLGLPLSKIGFPFAAVRFGLPRTPSLMGHYNIFGLYALFFFTLDFSLYRRIRWQNLLLALGVFLSISRMVWVAFFLVILIFLLRKKSMPAFILFLVGLLLMVISVAPFLGHTALEMGSGGGYFRGYALSKSLEIWRDHPLLGVGPGMYGGIVSLVFNSSIYALYDFSPYWFNYIESIGSLDQFLPQIMAEMGLLGVLSFGFLLFTLWRIARKASLVATGHFRKEMLFGFSIIPIVLALYLLGSGLNLTAFLLTYSVLFGMVLGMKNENTAC
ncbi:MAG: O-antigen ligase family protein [Deltaproteobacteria bacterium]|nr:O-antigen ligase family protein [Deltaproteobacteria bacterium]